MTAKAPAAGRMPGGRRQSNCKRMDHMPGVMSGKRGLVMGVANDHSIAWGIARMLARQGATLAFTYQGDALGRRVKPLADSVGSTLVLPCDVEQIETVEG